jgi:hypothetical protein
MKAFPIANMEGDEEFLGMDLRDYFAAKAMQAIIGKSDDVSINIVEVDNWIGDYAYVVADAMMKARNVN